MAVLGESGGAGAGASRLLKVAVLVPVLVGY